MSARICTSEWFVSDYRGLDVSEQFLPRVVADLMAASTKDGAVERTPDPIPFIDADLRWSNTGTRAQVMFASIHKASRTLIASNPNTLVFDDAISSAISYNPVAGEPYAVRNGFGTRLKTTRSTNSSMQFTRIFADSDDSVEWRRLGICSPGMATHLRYRCLFSTPGEWRTPAQPRHEAYARWAKIRLWAAPYMNVL